MDEAIKEGIAPAIVVAIYLIITKIIDSRKENVQLKLNSELTKSVNTISAFIVNITKDVIDKDKDKCKAAIEESIYSSGARLIQFVTNTLINNHIEQNKNTILINIHNIVHAEYYMVYSTLSLYKIDEIKASDYLSKKWIEDIEKDILKIVYNDNMTKEDKILSFNNKINLKFKNYITYITNNVIK